jgi:hypothetical protein
VRLGAGALLGLGDVDARARRERVAVRLTIAAAVWSLGLVIGALVLPVYDGTISTRDGTTFVAETIVAGNGAWVLIPISVPLVMCLVVAVALRRKRAGTDRRSGVVAWVAIAVLGAFALFSILWIGAFIIPVAILLAAGATLSRAAGAPADPGRAPRARRA